MKIIKVNPNNLGGKTIEKVAKILKNGGVVIYPTDTVYGLGANALDEGAVKKIFQIKGRDFNKPISIIVKDVKMAKKVANFGKDTKQILEKIFPGPVTAILFKKKILPDILTANKNKIGIRIPDCIVTKLIMENLDFPITTTSANISGESASGTINEILNQFKNKNAKPNLVLDAGVLPESQPSTIIDLTGPKPQILRSGPVTKKELFKILSL